MKRRLKLLTIAFGLFSSTFLPLATQASAASSSARVYFAQSSFSAAEGGEISMPLRLDAAGSTINAVDIQVSFPTSQLSFVGLNKSGSFFNIVVPATPTAANGKLEFSAASLGTATSDDVLVATLVFSAKISSGSAQVSLSGSEAANAGNTVDISTSATNVAFTSGGSVGKLGLDNVLVSDVTVNNGTVHWHTDVASSSSVDYGSNIHYGFSTGSTDLTTDHVVQLAPMFSGKTSVHYTVNSISADGTSQSSGDHTFTTTGYTIEVTVHNDAGQVLSGAKVSIAGGKVMRTDSAGKVILHDVSPGNQKIVINGGKVQLIAVRSLNGKAATDVQKFTLTKTTSAAVWYLVLGVLVAVALVVILLRQRAKRQTASSAS